MIWIEGRRYVASTLNSNGCRPAADTHIHVPQSISIYLRPSINTEFQRLPPCGRYPGRGLECKCGVQEDRDEGTSTQEVVDVTKCRRSSRGRKSVGGARCLGPDQDVSRILPRLHIWRSGICTCTLASMHTCNACTSIRGGREDRIEKRGVFSERIASGCSLARNRESGRCCTQASRHSTQQTRDTQQAAEEMRVAMRYSNAFCLFGKIISRTHFAACH
jgi:hypothetical protein